MQIADIHAIKIFNHKLIKLARFVFCLSTKKNRKWLPKDKKKRMYMSMPRTEML